MDNLCQHITSGSNPGNVSPPRKYWITSRHSLLSHHWRVTSYLFPRQWQSYRSKWSRYLGCSIWQCYFLQWCVRARTWLDIWQRYRSLNWWYTCSTGHDLSLSLSLIEPHEFVCQPNWWFTKSEDAILVPSGMIRLSNKIGNVPKVSMRFMLLLLHMLVISVDG